MPYKKINLDWYEKWYHRLITHPRDVIKYYLKPKLKLEKEHKQIGLTYWDRPFKVDYDPVSQMAWKIFPILVRYKRMNRMGYPFLQEFEEKENAEQLWEEILDKIIYAFQELILNEELHFDDIIDKKVDEGLALFAKYYRNLWD